MAAKKVYAVRKGCVVGLFKTWDACKMSIDGYPGAEYKGFAAVQEAMAYLGLDAGAEEPWKDAEKTEVPESARSFDDRIESTKTRIVVYVDGSYEDSIKKYAFGCVFLNPDGRVFVQFGNGNNEQSLQHRNVTGEMLGAMYAVKAAMVSGYSEIELRYDYEGIEKWVTGAWRSKTELTQKYTESMRSWGRQIGIYFTKVAAHTNVKYNELADEMAKKGLVEGEGVPKVCKIEEMILWNPSD